MENTNSYLKPDDYGVPKNEDWYLQYARYVGSKYNHVIPRFNTTDNIEDPLTRPWRWASRVMQLYAYLFAEQYKGSYDYMSMDENNNPLPIKLLNTHVIYQLVKHMSGTMQGNISSLPDNIFARSTDSEYLKYKNNLFNLAKVKIEMRELFDLLEKGGMEFNPMGDKEFTNTDDLKKYMEETLQSAMERYFTAWAKDWLYKTDYMSWVKLLFRYLVPAYFNRVELYVENWQVKIKIPKPQMCIWDNSSDDEFGRKQKYQGIIEEFSIPQLKTAYPELTKEQLDDFKAQAGRGANNGVNTNISLSDSIVWFNTSNNVPVVAVLKTRFISLNEDNEACWYQCDLIGNKVPLRRKECDNMVKTSQGYLGTPFIDFIPEIIAGKNKGPIDMSMDLADKIRGYEGKIDLLVHRIKGNIVTLFADKFPDGANAMTIAQDISNGILTLQGVDIDDMSESEKRAFMFKVENIGMDYNSYQSLRAEVEIAKNEIRSIFSIPTLSLGSQKGVVGARAQEQSIQQATFGVTPLYDGFSQYLNGIIHAACEMRKNLMLLADETEEMEEVLQVTKKDFSIMKLTKDMALTDMAIYLDNKDTITEEERALLIQLFERELQNPNGYVDSVVVSEALAADTNTELRNILKYHKRIWEAKQAAIAEAQAEQAAIAQQNQLAAQQQMTQTQNAGKLANTQLKGTMELEKEQMQLENQGNEQPV